MSRHAEAMASCTVNVVFGNHGVETTVASFLSATDIGRFLGTADRRQYLQCFHVHVFEEYLESTLLPVHVRCVIISKNVMCMCGICVNLRFPIRAWK